MSRQLPDKLFADAYASANTISDEQRLFELLGAMGLAERDELGAWKFCQAVDAGFRALDSSEGPGPSASTAVVLSWRPQRCRT